MRDGTKIKYLKILSVYGDTVKSLGENAPYVSKSRIVELVIRQFNNEGIKMCRTVIYEALKNASPLEDERRILA